MLFGFCTGSAAQDTYRVGADRIGLLAEMGYDYVELPLGRLMQMPQDAFESQILGRLADAGIACLRMNNLFPPLIHACGPQADLGAVAEYSCAAFARMQACGAQVAVYGSPAARNAAPGVSAAQAAADYCKSLEAMLPAARKYDVTIAVEPLNAMESNLIHTVDEGAIVAAKMNDPQIGLLADLYHMHLAREGFETLARNGMLLRHIHLARTLGRTLPCPGDEEDYTGFFAALYRGGYCRTVSIEGHPSGDFAKQAQAALAHLRACDEKARLLAGIEENR